MRMEKSSLLSALLLLLAILSGQCKKTHIEGDPFSICVHRNHQGRVSPSSVETENCTPLAQTIDLAGQFNNEDKSNSEMNNWVPRSSNVVCVDEFGAKGDGENDDTKAFNNAWSKACSSAPAVFLVPHGKRYLVKPIKFSGPCKSALTMQVSGTIIAPADPRVWDGLNRRQWLRFKEVDDLTVEGGGTFYGSGQQWWAESCKINKTNPCRPAPTAITFELCNNLRVMNLIVENSQQMHIKFRKCVRVKADNLKVLAPGHSPNTDGIHVSASKDVVIKNTITGTGDDCISIVSDSFNIYIENITCGPGHGISIGSLGEGSAKARVADVMVHGAFLHNTTNGLRIKTWQGSSGSARRILFQNVHMENVKHPIIIDQYYCDSKKPCSNKTSAVKVSEVAYLNIKGTSASKEVMRFACSQTVPCENILLADIDLTATSGCTPTTYCENAIGCTTGSVSPHSCLQNYNQKGIFEFGIPVSIDRRKGKQEKKDYISHLQR